MRARINDPEKIARIATIANIALMVCWGAGLVFFQYKPFWRDEWCIIYNIKFKTAKMLWGPLDFTQQFPRVYLQVIKWFTSVLDYSYFSMRFPAFLVASVSAISCYALMKKMYPVKTLSRYLFPMILISHQVFMDYYVQIKHYEMEILLSLLAIWQFMELVSIRESGVKSNGRYLLLCLSFLVAPFFSYTYPIAIAPVFIIVFLQGVNFIKVGGVSAKGRNTLLQWLPLVICLCSIIAFYVIDVSQLMADRNMREYWHERMLGGKSFPEIIVAKIWLLFALVGSGLVFEIIFGILGISAFFYSFGQFIRDRNNNSFKKGELLRLYAMLLLLVVIGLFITGNLPLGEAKFNAFAVPSISILIIYLVDRLRKAARVRKFAGGLLAVLLLALSGNIVSAVVNMFTSAQYAKRVSIYRYTESALNLAYQKKIPVMVTAGVGYPDDIACNIHYLSMPDAAGVLKTFPGYKVEDTLAVYTISKADDVNKYRNQLPAQTKMVLAGDGLTYKIVQLDRIVFNR